MVRRSLFLVLLSFLAVALPAAGRAAEEAGPAPAAPAAEKPVAPEAGKPPAAPSAERTVTPEAEKPPDPPQAPTPPSLPVGQITQEPLPVQKPVVSAPQKAKAAAAKAAAGRTTAPPKQRKGAEPPVEDPATADGLTPEPASAGPGKDVFVYLDRSGTIVTGSKGAPSANIAEMLQQLFLDESNGLPFLQPGDRIHLMTFGETVENFGAPIDAGEKNTWITAMRKFGEQKRVQQGGKDITDFAALFRNITATTKIGDGRTKIILIASKFVHDPTNEVKPLCALWKDVRDRGRVPAGEALDGFAATIQPGSTGERPFLGLLQVAPDLGLRDKRPLNRDYVECFTQLYDNNPIVNRLGVLLGIRPISYQEVKNNKSGFVARFLSEYYSARLPPLDVDKDSLRYQRTESGVRLTMTVRNNGLVNNELRQITLSTKEKPGDGTSYEYKLPAPLVVPQQSQQTIEVPISYTIAARQLTVESQYITLSDKSRASQEGAAPAIAVRALPPLPPTIAEARPAGGSGNPYRVDITLRNDGVAPSAPASIDLFDSHDSAVIKWPFEDRLESGQWRTIAIPIDKGAQDILFTGDTFSAGIRAKDAASVPQDTKKVIPSPSRTLVEITDVGWNTTGGRFAIGIKARNPDTLANVITGVDVFELSSVDGSVANGAEPLLETKLNPPIRLTDDKIHSLAQIEIPPDRQASLTERGPVLVTLRLEAGTSGDMSRRPRIILPAPNRTALAVDKPTWVRQPDGFKLQLIITNPGEIDNRLTSVVVYENDDRSGEKKEWVVPGAGQLVRPGGEKTQITVPFPEEWQRQFFAKPAFFLQLVDRSVNLGAPVPIETPEPTRFEIKKAATGAVWTSRDQRYDLAVDVTNKGTVGRYLAPVQMLTSEQAKDGQTAAIDQRHFVRPNETVRVQIPLNYPAQKDYLAADQIYLREVGVADRDGKAPTFAMPPAPREGLTLLNTKAKYDALSGKVTLPIHNNGKLPNRLTAIEFYQVNNTTTPRYVYTLPTPMTIDPDKDHTQYVSLESKDKGAFEADQQAGIRLVDQSRFDGPPKSPPVVVDLHGLRAVIERLEVRDVNASDVKRIFRLDFKIENKGDAHPSAVLATAKVAVRGIENKLCEGLDEIKGTLKFGESNEIAAFAQWRDKEGRCQSDFAEGHVDLAITTDNPPPQFVSTFWKFFQPWMASVWFGFVIVVAFYWFVTDKGSFRNIHQLPYTAEKWSKLIALGSGTFGLGPVTWHNLIDSVSIANYQVIANLGIVGAAFTMALLAGGEFLRRGRQRILAHVGDGTRAPVQVAQRALFLRTAVIAVGLFGVTVVVAIAALSPEAIVPWNAVMDRQELINGSAR